MRIWETCLLMGAALVVIAMRVPALSARRWIRLACAIVPVLAVIQIGVEGIRWQMVPAYALALGIGAVGWRTLPRRPDTRQGRRVLRVLLGAGVALVFAVAVALPSALPVFSFPTPTGPFALGTLTYTWQDATRAEILTEDPNDTREIVAQIWYPALAEPGAPRVSYSEDADAISPYQAKVFDLPPFFLTHLRYVMTHAVHDAPVAPDPATYPVLVYLSGLGGGRQLSMFQIEELVSQGYIVVGLDQPGGSAAVRLSDGRISPGWGRSLNPLIDQSGAPQTPTPTLFGVPMPEGIMSYFAQDASFALDELAGLNAADPQGMLTGRLDLERVGVFGISLGAIDGSEACAKDKRFKACLLMDGFATREALRLGMQQATFWLTRPADTMRLERATSGGWSEQDIAITRDTMRTAHDTSAYESYFVEMPTMYHVNFTDVPYFSPFFAQIGLIGPIDPQRGFDIVNAYSVAFFDKVLKGRSSPVLEGQVFPEAHLDVHRP